MKATTAFECFEIQIHRPRIASVVAMFLNKIAPGFRVAQASHDTCLKKFHVGQLVADIGGRCLGEGGQDGFKKGTEHWGIGKLMNGHTKIFGLAAQSSVIFTHVDLVVLQALPRVFETLRN